MRNLKKFISGLLLFIPLISAGQTNWDTIYVFDLHQQEYFKETSEFKLTTQLLLMEEVSYDGPPADDEYVHLLRIRIFDTSKFSSGTTFDVQKDTALIKCDYKRVSIWNFGNKNNFSISGQVTVDLRDDDKMKLKFSLTVIDFDNDNKLLYQGERFFSKTDKFHQFKF